VCELADDDGVMPIHYNESDKMEMWC